MPNFILNKNAQKNGDHEVHNTTSGCSFMPKPENQLPMGTHVGCQGAVANAKQINPNHRINGCYYCCRECHTS